VNAAEQEAADRKDEAEANEGQQRNRQKEGNDALPSVRTCEAPPQSRGAPFRLHRVKPTVMGVGRHHAEARPRKA
jgi:hypothetical protein